MKPIFCGRKASHLTGIPSCMTHGVSPHRHSQSHNASTSWRQVPPEALLSRWINKNVDDYLMQHPQEPQHIAAVRPR